MPRISNDEDSSSTFIRSPQEVLSDLIATGFVNSSSVEELLKLLSLEYKTGFSFFEKVVQWFKGSIQIADASKLSDYILCQMDVRKDLKAWLQLFLPVLLKNLVNFITSIDTKKFGEALASANPQQPKEDRSYDHCTEGV